LLSLLLQAQSQIPKSNVVFPLLLAAMAAAAVARFFGYTQPRSCPLMPSEVHKREKRKLRSESPAGDLCSGHTHASMQLTALLLSIITMLLGALRCRAFAAVTLTKQSATLMLAQQGYSQTAAGSAAASKVDSVFATDRRPVVLFDGVCNFCNTWVNAALDLDPDGTALR
jgi:hypothetical protein